MSGTHDDGGFSFYNWKRVNYLIVNIRNILSFKTVSNAYGRTYAACNARR